jgi:ABC-type sulfate/molybdate transport systems ATPase subunit
MPLLRLTGVAKRFGAHGGVHDLSLDVDEGDSLVVFGPSGSGKTTLLRLIAGLEVPDRGEVWLDGRQVASARRNIVPSHARRIGFVFQDLALWPHLTARQNLEFVATTGPRGERADRVEEALSLCRVEANLAGRFPHQLSGGEQQRVALARALVGAPRLLLLDEPFSSLDPELRITLRAELHDLQRRLALTTIFVSHDADDARAFGRRTVTVRDGRLDTVSP